jgi:hypothetical protein
MTQMFSHVNINSYVCHRQIDEGHMTGKGMIDMDFCHLM